MLPHTGSIAFRRRSSLRGILLSSSSSCEETYVHFMPHRNSGYIAPFQRRSIHKNSETPRYVSWGLKELPDTKHVQNILKREHHIPESRLSAPQPIVHGPLELIHADTHIAVISKPSGLLTLPGAYRKGLDCALYRLHELLQQHPGIPKYSKPSQPTEEMRKQTELRRMFEEKVKTLSAKSRKRKRRKAVRDGSYDESSLTPFPIGVHRLDMATSGIMVFARNKRAARLLSKQFADRIMEKTYEAVLDTRLAEWTKDSPILKQDEGDLSSPLPPETRKSLGDPFNGKAVKTKWEVIERGNGAVRVKFTPLTGRAHQLRLHAALPPPYGLNSPIYGDLMYPHAYPGPQTAVGILGRFSLSEFHGIEEISAGKSWKAVVSGMNALNSIYHYIFMKQIGTENLKDIDGPWPVVSAIIDQLPYPRLSSCPYLNEEAVANFKENRKRLIEDKKVESFPFFVPRLLLHARSLGFTENFLSQVTEEKDQNNLKSSLRPHGDRRVSFYDPSRF